MKKLVFCILIVFLLVPIEIKALSLGTKIIGNEKVKPGTNVVYTVILDYELDDYSAEITYDRNVLNLVDVKEININTTTVDFNYEKNNPIKIDIKSKAPVKIVYMLEFNVKNFVSEESTEVSIKTLKAKSDDEELTASEDYIKANIVKESIVQEDDSNDEVNEIKSVMNDVKNILNNYGNPITYVSLGLNLILIIILFFNIRRKKVDYDF